ncbi:MAG: hypothetical protein ACOY9C_02000 [Pseudomonadota bacterium]
MSKRLTTPMSRLICFGSAKASTNAFRDEPIPEDVPELGFPD